MSFDAVGIVSSNIKKSIEFYEILGLNFKSFGEDNQHFEAVTKSGVRVMLDSEELILKLNPKWTRAKGNSSIVIGFKQTTPEEVDFLYTKIAQAGFKTITKPWDAFWGQRYACVADPDSNQIDLFANL